MMKKIISLMLALALLCAMGSAFADVTTEPITDADGKQIGVTIRDAETGRISLEKYGLKDPSNPAGDAEKTVHYIYDANGKLILTEKDEQVDDRNEVIKLYDEAGKLLSTSEISTNPNTGEIASYEYDGDGKLELVSYSNDKGYVSLDGNGKLIYAGTGDVGYDAQTGKWTDSTGKEVSAPNLSSLIDKVKEMLKKRQKAAQPEPLWYTNNTACVPGIRLRDEYPNLTSKWYNVLPVDLSRDGTQTFDLVASNMYYLGKVYVTVAGDDVTVDYSYLQHVTYQIKPLEELVTWFTGIEQITTEFLENPTSEMKYGQAISKEKDLNGQDTALLFVCNRVTYRTPLNSDGAMPIRYWPNSSKLADYFANVRTLLERNEAQYAEKKAAANP